ncbi:MAG: xanthine dehydrogenase family protein molybdopterin-binding subunit [Burkholderiaceae bacterium]
MDEPIEFSPGQPAPRTEDKRFVTGTGRFADDVVLAGQAYAVMVRSPYPHARIGTIDSAAAREMPGVLAVLTGQDWAGDGLGGLTGPGHMLPTPPLRTDGVPFVNPPRPGLPLSRVLFAGEAVAVVVGETLIEALDAAELIDVAYEELEAAVTIAAALEPRAPNIRDDAPGNVYFRQCWGDEAATAAAFDGAPHVISQRIVISRVYANTMEPRSFNAFWDPQRDHCTIWGGVHRAFGTRDMLTRDVFGIGPEQMDVVPGDLGGSFGLRGGVPVEMALVAWASRRTRRPVKWTATRSELLLADDHGRDMIADAELAFDDQGRIHAFRTHNLNNIGAHVSYYGLAPATNNIGGHVGPYTIPVAFVDVTGVCTNTTSNTPYRGSGRPEATTVIERMVDLAAARIGLDPAEMRRRNLIPKDAFPYKTALTFTYDCGEFESVLDKVMFAMDYQGFPARRAGTEARGKLRGLGVAFAIESAGAPGVEIADLVFSEDGTVTILAGTTNHGQGHETILTQYVCGRLGIEPAAVRVIESDTRVVRMGYGTGGSRSAAFVSGAILNAIANVVDAGLPIAAHLLNTPPGDIVFSDQVFRDDKTGRSIAFSEVARAAFDTAALPPGRGPGLGAEGMVRLESRNFPNGCQICEVEIDPQTGVVEVVAHGICDDVGFEINPALVKGQLHGGAAQGLGQGLLEYIAFDAGGQLQTGSFMDYAMPRATDLPFFTVSSHPVPTATNPTGVKGVGESGSVGALPALMNAVNDALARAGVPHLDMPATPFRVWSALQGRSS